MFVSIDISQNIFDILNDVLHFIMRHTQKYTLSRDQMTIHAKEHEQLPSKNAYD